MIENTFSVRSQEYAQARPTYPAELYAWIAAQCSVHDQAWDCATGNGQAAVDLAKYFRIVRATDISAEQIDHQIARPNVEYSVQPAEKTSFERHQFDLVTVGQALHWFDYAKFWPEVERVSKPGAFFCAWGYDWIKTGSAIDEVLVKPFLDLIAPYWAANNRIMWDGYKDADVAFPFVRVAAPPMDMRMDWSAQQLIAYLRTWSAYKGALEHGPVAAELAKVVHAAEQAFDLSKRLEIRMPLKMLAGHVPRA